MTGVTRVGAVQADPDEVDMVSAGIGLLLIGILFIVMSTAMKSDGLTRNRAVGIRTRATIPQ